MGKQENKNVRLVGLLFLILFNIQNYCKQSFCKDPKQQSICVRVKQDRERVEKKVARTDTCPKNGSIALFPQDLIKDRARVCFCVYVCVFVCTEIACLFFSQFCFIFIMGSTKHQEHSFVPIRFVPCYWAVCFGSIRSNRLMKSTIIIIIQK